MTESQVMHDIRLALAREPDVTLWRNNTGALRSADGRLIQYGLCVGSSDLIGIGPGGRFLAIEVKGPRGVVSDEQERFIALVRRRGGIAGVASSVEDAMGIVEAARMVNEARAAR